MSSPASHPSTQYIEGSKQEGHILYKGTMEGEEVTFKFHLENKTFLCETKIEGEDVIMCGELEVLGDKKYKLNPKWGINPDEGGKMEDTSSEEVKEIDCTSGSFDFEGCKCSLVK